MRIWRNADGLPSDSVTAIIQSRDGFLWVGTGSGLVRFDGVVSRAL
jgi:ligand-binding sensor domain-containing protein